MTEALSAVRSWLDRYRTRPVLVGWTVLTLLLVGYVSLAQSQNPATAAFPVGPLGVVSVGYAEAALAGVALAAWTRRPVAAFGGTALVGIATLDVSGGCLLAACPGGPTGWQFALDATPLGPELLVAYLDSPTSCLRNCPHSVYLAPLSVGYLLLGEALTPADPLVRRFA